MAFISIGSSFSSALRSRSSILSTHRHASIKSCPRTRANSRQATPHMALDRSSHHLSPTPRYLPVRRSAATDDALSGGNAKTASKFYNLYIKTSTILTNLFPVWTLLCALLALRKPSSFLWLNPAYFGYTLGVLMLSMGITLTPEDFRRTLKRLGAVTIGFIACYGLMPALALLLARLFKLPPELTAGTILVSAVNGGQASNLCTYIANGDVALSVMMTTSTTLGAIIMTPLLTKLMIGTAVPMDTLGIALSTVQVVLAPITLGMFLNKYAHRFVQAILPFSPVVGVIATCVLVGASIAQSAGPIFAAGMSLQIPIMLLHLIGGLLGYWVVAAVGYPEIVRRTVAIETAMKSSAFGFLLATLHFGAYMVRIPSAVSVVWMALVGSCLAVAWRFVPLKSKNKPSPTTDASVASNPPTMDNAPSLGS